MSEEFNVESDGEGPSSEWLGSAVREVRKAVEKGVRGARGLCHLTLDLATIEAPESESDEQNCVLVVSFVAENPKQPIAVACQGAVHRLNPWTAMFCGITAGSIAFRAASTSTFALIMPGDERKRWIQVPDLWRPGRRWRRLNREVRAIFNRIAEEPGPDKWMAVSYYFNLQEQVFSELSGRKIEIPMFPAEQGTIVCVAKPKEIGGAEVAVAMFTGFYVAAIAWRHFAHAPLLLVDDDRTRGYVALPDDYGRFKLGEPCGFFSSDE